MGFIGEKGCIYSGFNRYMVECEYTKANLMKMIAGTF